MRVHDMPWDDLRALIRRCEASGAQVTYYRDRHSDPDNIAVLDRGLPRRKGVYETGHAEEDHFRDSKVCEAAWFNGRIPMIGSEGKRENSKFVEQPYRGALSVLEHLLREGCLRRTDELRDLFRDYGRRLP